MTQQNVTVQLCEFDGATNSLVRIHELETGRFEGIVRRNEPGSWRVDCQLDEVPPDVLAAVDGVVVADPTRILFAGWRSPGETGQGGTLREIDESGRRAVIEGVDCWFWLTSRVCYPDPTKEPPWTTQAYDVRSGLGGNVIADYIAVNAGVFSLPGRGIGGLLTPVQNGLGSKGEWSARLQPLSEIVRRVALDSGLVVEPTLDAARKPLIQVREASNLTASVVVADIADLAYAEQRDVPARSTYVVAAGAGEGTARMFRTAGGGDGVFRIEKVVEYVGAQTTTELFQYAEAIRREDGFAFYVSGRTNEEAAETYRYLEDYRLGDLISVQVQGLRFPVPITAVTITVTPERVVQTPTLGIYTPDRLQGLKKDVADLAERFHNGIT